MRAIETSATRFPVPLQNRVKSKSSRFPDASIFEQEYINVSQLQGELMKLDPKIPAVAKRKNPVSRAFGARLIAARKAKGLTQAELARQVGTSQRMIAYYETQHGTPSGPVLLRLAETLAVDPNELIGLASAPSAQPDTPTDLRLWRKLRRVESLPPEQRKTVVQLIDALVDRQPAKK